MTFETANALIGILANNLNVTIENQNKLLALEKTLEESERALYLSYSTHFERIRANSPTPLPLLELADLQAKLVQG